jgi:hypothetical protein
MKNSIINRKSLWILLAGSLLMAFPVLTRSFIPMTPDLGDFVKGLGVALMIWAAISQRFAVKRSAKTESK